MNKTTNGKTVRRTFQNPSTFASNGLRYFVAPDGRHNVVHTMTCGEDIAPNVYRFPTIEEARSMWRTLEAIIKNRGYTKKVDNDLTLIEGFTI